MMACVLSGILGDLLVVEGGVSLRVLMWISAAFVWAGFIVGLFVIRSAYQQQDTLDEQTEGQISKHSSMSHKSYGQRAASPSPDNFFKESPFVHSATGHHLEHITAGEEFFGGNNGGGQGNGDYRKSIAQNLDRNRFVREVFHGHSTTSAGWKATVLVFQKQMLYLGIALKANSFRMMLALWIIGNAIFSVSL
jgi:hypothetical protein